MFQETHPNHSASGWSPSPRVVRTRLERRNPSIAAANCLTPTPFRTSNAACVSSSATCRYPRPTVGACIAAFSIVTGVLFVLGIVLTVVATVATASAADSADFVPNRLRRCATSRPARATASDHAVKNTGAVLERGSQSASVNDERSQP